MTMRRNFIRQLMAGGILLPSIPSLLWGKKQSRQAPEPAANGVRLGLIGCGSQGTSDTSTALRVDGVRLTAVCDLFDDRLAAAKKRWGDTLFTTKDYRELLKRNDVDAVIVATPDHWHLDISVDAMKAGKHVYCEKPVIHKLGEAKAMINAQQVSGVCFQAGSQGMASAGNRKARQLVLEGIIGKVNFIDGQFSSAPRTPDSYKIPATASAETIWWDRFIGKASRRDFDAQRFLYWRNWKDYSTGIAGDLFVHVLASLHYITDAHGPEKVYTTGGIYNKLDPFRDTPDIMLGYFNYPDRNNVGAFTVQLGANYVDGVSRAWGSMNFLVVGSGGKLRVEWNRVTLTSLKPVDTDRLSQLSQVGDGIDAFEVISPNEVVFRVSEGYRGGHCDHLSNFINGIRNGSPIAADVTFGVQSAAPALLCYESYLSGSPVYWDAEKLEVIRK